MNNELRKKYLGIDWGEKRIGLALADSETKIAIPFKTVATADEVIAVIKDEEVDLVILGKPISISNPEFTISKQFENFLSELKSKTTVEVIMVDERLSSKAADALPGDKKTKSSRDEIAAMLILQSYLDGKI
jgi:putative holliday junction resolvase